MRITASWSGSLHPPHTRMWHERSCTMPELPSTRHPDHNKRAVVLGALKAKPYGGPRSRRGPALTAPARAGKEKRGSGRRNGCQVEQRN
jgi:hypothetical protein